VLVEPWFAPDAWTPGRVFVQTAESERVKVCRMSHSARRDRLSVVTFEYLIGTAEGIEHKRERHELGLFEPEEMKACFREAGFDVEHDPAGPTGRGLYIAHPGARAPA
jgi:hypothetical protein